MKLPLSNRLLTCASLLHQGCRAADIGADHGYLAIYLLKAGIAQSVIAADLREQPLAKARYNARRYDVQENITFFCTDGLRGIDAEAIDSVICAGMGGDCIIHILQEAPWLKDARYSLVLQPQSSPQALRAYLAQEGFAIERETLARDGRFYYTVLRARYTGETRTLTPGQAYVSEALLASGSEHLGAYLERVCRALQTTAEGLSRADHADPTRVRYYMQAYQEVEDIRSDYGTGHL